MHLSAVSVVAASGFVIQVKDMAAYLATILIDKGFMIFFSQTIGSIF